MDIMLDIETLGTERDCVILSIGAVAFEPYAANCRVEDVHFYATCTIFDQLLNGRTIDNDTVNWWRKKSAEAKAAITDAPAIRLPDALKDLKVWLDAMRIKSGRALEGIWAKSPEFDCTILEHAYQQAGFECPWTFRERRDVRTINKVGHHFNPKTLGRDGTAHNALDDCIQQAREVQYSIWNIRNSLTMPEVPTQK